ncbi:hypothetical protein CSPX01_10608 [Colletotrichum filicis]|nr:hypothetical protein CSPX01_10608 [Colletotrichum filicis]
MLTYLIALGNSLLTISFNRLFHFEEDGEINYGDMIDSSDDKGFDVLELDGSPWLGLKSTGRKVKTAKSKVPTFPVIFTKPSDALAGPLDDIKVHPDAQIQLDYEGELVVIIGHDAKDVKEDQALNYVLGYTAGNDVSARNFQLPDASGG